MAGFGGSAICMTNRMTIESTSAALTYGCAAATSCSLLLCPQLEAHAFLDALVAEQSNVGMGWISYRSRGR